MYGCLGPKMDQLSHIASGGVFLHLCFVLILSFEKTIASREAVKYNILGGPMDPHPQPPPATTPCATADTIQTRKLT